MPRISEGLVPDDGAARGSEPLLVRVGNLSGKPLLFLPLCLERRLGVQLLQFPDGGVCDYCAPVIRPGHVFDPRDFGTLWQKILSRLPSVDLIDLRNLPDRIIETPNPFLGLGLGPVQGFGSYIRIDDDWQSYSREPSRRALLSQAARKLRKLSRNQAVTFVEAHQKAIDFILEQKSRQYLRTLGKDVMAMPGYQPFFRLIAAPEQLGRLSTFDCLMVGDEMAVGHLGYATANRDYYILTATNYDLFGKHSLGTSLFSRLLQKSVAKGNKIFDLGIGSEAYKDLWATGRYRLYSYLEPLTARGRLAASALAFKHSPLVQRTRTLRSHRGTSC